MKGPEVELARWMLRKTAPTPLEGNTMAIGRKSDGSSASPISKSAELVPSPSSASASSVPSMADEVDWIDYMDSEGESYVFFAIDDDWPRPSGSATSGAP
jgi:hypothetical protein